MRSAGYRNRGTGSVTSSPALTTPRPDRERARRLPPASVALSPRPHPSASPARGQGSPVLRGAMTPGQGASRLIAQTTNTDTSLDMSIHMSKISFNPEDDTWRMSTFRTPKSAEIVCPIPWADFQAKLDFDEDTISSLESLVQMDDLCFRVQIIRDMAFVYEPFAMDGTHSSVILDWGSPEDNQGTASYITNNLPSNRVFHTFTLPSKKDSSGTTSWYYIGAHTWAITPHFDIWRVLSDKSKKTVVTRLKRRCKGSHSDFELYQRIGDGRLEQFCVEVSSRSLKDVSEAFAESKLGYARPAKKRPSA
ncbi:hypothetical protein HYDPIDRAFT_104793 [Hydnomerulius pinastri MD-312]|nr:hypothetical protein HYDPIDRAFT_104793 [Hydnomerulius pinastri MD-312]